MEEFENEASGFKRWFQDNLRILISILIVVVIAGGIYSYSKRSAEVAFDDDASIDEIAEELKLSEEGSKEEKGDEIKKKPEEDKKSTESQKAPAETKTQPKEDVSSESTSRETESSFIEEAGKGEGKTHLARKALANYLEKNPDSSLTKEHKIYIEDYLRKRMNSSSVKVGSTAEFSKQDIQNAIEKSKALSEKQLKNLEKYSARVASLS